MYHKFTFFRQILSKFYGTLLKKQLFNSLASLAYIELTLITAGGGISTIYDLVKWNYSLYSKKIIPDFALKYMTSAFVEKRGFPFYDGEEQLFAGYGIDIIDKEGSKLYQHCGGTSGYQSKISYNPDTDITIVNLSNFSEENSSLFSFANELREISKKWFLQC